MDILIAAECCDLWLGERFFLDGGHAFNLEGTSKRDYFKLRLFSKMLRMYDATGLSWDSAIQKRVW
jgi:hypothetical protein